MHLIAELSICLLLIPNEGVGWILRLPCKIEANFSVSAVGHALAHNVILTLTGSLNECKQQCIFTSDCKAINHRQSGVDNCELNSQTNVSKPGTLMARRGWTYYATNQTSKFIGSLCKKIQPCKSWQLCIDDCSCPGYRCIFCNQASIMRYDLSCNYKGVNLALKKPATLSSQYDHYTVAANAVDGSLYASHRTCAITEEPTVDPWFRVDLLEPYPVNAVSLQNRFNLLYALRMNPFDVRVGSSLQDSGRVNPKCVDQGSFLTNDEYLHLKCPKPLFGRYVIVFAESAYIMELCELEVYESF